MAQNQNVLHLQQQVGSADTTSVFYAVTQGTTDTGLPFTVLVNNLGLLGTPTAPTAASGTNTTQIASTAFVQNAVSGGAYAGSFTTLTATGTVSGAGFTTLLAPYALKSGTLAQFAATTSAQLAGIISDETGSGSLVFGTSPTLTTPAITGGTINNASVGATTPSTGAFTTLSASSTVSGTGFSTYLASPPAIGSTAPNTGKFTTLQATGAITPSTTAGIIGTTLGDSANAGSIGEVISNSATNVSLTSGTTANVTSISLTAGDWDVSGTVRFNPAGTTTATLEVAGISTTTATVGGLGSFTQIQVAFPAGAIQYTATPVIRINVTTTTTVYLVALATFATSTMTADGLIRARRVR